MNDKLIFVFVLAVITIPPAIRYALRPNERPQIFRLWSWCLIAVLFVQIAWRYLPTPR